MVKLLDLLRDASAAHEAILLVILLEGRRLVTIVLRLVVGQVRLRGSTLVCSVTVRLNFDARRLVLLLGYYVSLRGHYGSG